MAEASKQPHVARVGVRVEEPHLEDLIAVHVVEPPTQGLVQRLGRPHLASRGPFNGTGMPRVQPGRGAWQSRRLLRCPDSYAQRGATGHHGNGPLRAPGTSLVRGKAKAPLDRGLGWPVEIIVPDLPKVVLRLTVPAVGNRDP